MTIHMARGCGRGLAREYNEKVKQSNAKARNEREAVAREDRLARATSRLDEFDTDGDGTISKSELKDALTQIKRELTGSEQATCSDASLKLIWGARLRCERLDGHGLLAAIGKFKALQAPEAAATQERFLCCYHDGSGGLSLVEFKELIAEFAPPRARYASGEAEEMMARCDVDGDGEVSLNELQAALADWLQMAPTGKGSSCAIS